MSGVSWVQRLELVLIAVCMMPVAATWFGKFMDWGKW